MSLQDQRTFILNPKSSEKKQNADNYARVSAQISKGPMGSTGQPLSVLEKRIDDGEKLPRVPSDVVDELVKLRLKAQLTRDQLAKLCNKPVDLIHKIETKTAIWKRAEIAEIKAALNRTIKIHEKMIDRQNNKQ